MAAGATYEPIATTTLGSAASTITFSSIPSTYTDLRVVLVARGTATTYPQWILNNDATALYSRTELTGNGTAASSTRGSANSAFYVPNAALPTAANTFDLITADIFSYAGSTFKTVLFTDSTDLNGSGEVAAIVGLYRSTTAISRVDIQAGASTFAAGTTATIYGIKAA